MKIKEIRIVCDGNNCLGPETEGMLKQELTVNDANESGYVSVEYLGFRMTGLFDIQGWKKLEGKHYCPSCWDELKRKNTNNEAIGN